MAKFPFMPLWTDDRIAFLAALGGAGWRSPDTYRREFAELPDAPGVYLLVAHEFDLCTIKTAFIAYAGQSITLCHRVDSKHEILQMLNRADYWVQRWFHVAAVGQIRDIERALIRHYDPPYNLIGRVRGRR